jgi:addiction module RelE/StbE family toxin
LPAKAHLRACSIGRQSAGRAHVRIQKILFRLEAREGVDLQIHGFGYMCFHNFIRWFVVPGFSQTPSRNNENMLTKFPSYL